MNRRSVIFGGAAALAFPLMRARAAGPNFTANPFSLGVASGCPTQGGCVLWTRLAPDPLNGGGLADTPVDVGWEVAEDENFARIVQRGTSRAVAELFQQVDVVIAPATPYTAPKLGQTMMRLNGVDLPVRANLGLFTQPISAIGLPVVATPCARAQGQMPIGVQIIAAPWREDLALRVARHLERAGIAASNAV